MGTYNIFLTIALAYTFSLAAIAQDQSSDQDAINKAFIKCLEKKSDDSEEIMPESARHWFLGFVEGRLETKPPEVWCEAFLKSSISRKKNASTVRTHQYLINDSPGLEFNKNVELTNRNGSVQIKQGKESILMPKSKYFNERTHLPSGFTASFKPDVVYIAQYHLPNPYSLLCVDRKTKKVVWQSMVSPTYGQITYTGLGHYHWVWIDADTDGNPIVFGCGLGTIYFERFDKKTGKKTLRFTSQKFDQR